MLSITAPSLAIAEGLAAADPTNIGWQRDLSIGRERLANLVQDGDGDGPARAQSRQP